METRDERGRGRHQDDTPLSAGQRVGRYRLERELGAGGMGVVWLASDPTLSRRVAIKFLRADPDTFVHAEERFLREARAMAALSHPNVVAIYDIGSADERVFFAMEFIEGTTLDHWTVAEPRGWREIVEMFAAAGRGLGAAHAAGLVHRDFKPANVLIGPDRVVKVADFGLVRAIDRDDVAPPRGGPLAPSLTNPGAVAGTPGYIAPEVLAGEIAGPAADQYAFAVSLREAFARASDQGPPELEAMLSRATATAVADRYPTIASLVGELQRLVRPHAARELVFGFPPTEQVSTKRRQAAAFVRYASQRAGLSIRATFAADYRELVEELVAGRIDIAWLPPLSLVRAGDHVRPVLGMLRAGKTSYQSAIVARRDSGIAGLDDLAGKRLAWVDEDSAAGYVFPRGLIAAMHPDVDAFLGSQRFLGSHRAVLEAVLNGWVDAGASYINLDAHGAIAVSGWQQLVGERRDELTAIAVTGSIPTDVVAVRADLGDEDRSTVITTIRELCATDEGRELAASVFNGARELVEVDPKSHAGLAEVARQAGWRP